MDIIKDIIYTYILIVIIIAPIIITIKMKDLNKKITQQGKDIETLKTTIETMLKMGYGPTKGPTLPSEHIPKYAAGDEMDDIKTGTPIQFY